MTTESKFIFLIIHLALHSIFLLKIYYNLPYASRAKKISYSPQPGVEVIIIFIVILFNPFSYKYYNNKIIFCVMMAIMLVSMIPFIRAILQNYNKK
jgi:hypothetical protein